MGSSGRCRRSSGGGLSGGRSLSSGRSHGSGQRLGSALNGQSLGASLTVDGLETCGSSRLVGVVQTETNRGVLPRLAVRAVGVGVGAAAKVVLAEGLASVHWGLWAAHGAGLGALAGRVGLVAHSGLRVISVVETEAHAGVLPRLAVRALGIGVVLAIVNRFAVRLARRGGRHVVQTNHSKSAGKGNESH